MLYENSLRKLSGNTNNPEFPALQLYTIRFISIMHAIPLNKLHILSMLLEPGGEFQPFLHNLISLDTDIRAR
jgi:hypothetical protein